MRKRDQNNEYFREVQVFKQSILFLLLFICSLSVVDLHFGHECFSQGLCFCLILFVWLGFFDCNLSVLFSISV